MIKCDSREFENITSAAQVLVTFHLQKVNMFQVRRFPLLLMVEGDLHHHIIAIVAHNNNNIMMITIIMRTMISANISSSNNKLSKFVVVVLLAVPQRFLPPLRPLLDHALSRTIVIVNNNIRISSITTIVSIVLDEAVVINF